ncbi:MAG: hypothetical protein C0413_04300 [Clostridiales bacterium]|nr:hypothetical protein [Clostridiales bacterium]
MILLICAFLGTLLGLIFGGSLSGIGQNALRGIWLPVAAFLLKAGAAALLQPQLGALEVCLVQYILLFIFCCSTIGGLFGRCLYLRAR